MSQQTLQRLSGRSAIVTGSTSGIGFAIAKRLAEEGAKVIISSRQKENVEKATKELRDQGLDVKGVVCHVSDPGHRKRLLQEAEEYNGLDILVCCAGVNPAVGPLFDCPDSAWQKIFDVNLKAPYLLTKEALYLLKQSKTGRVIYISSGSAFYVHHSLGVYALSKTALCALTKHAAFLLAADNITVNCVAPGVINTEFSEALRPNEKETEHLLSIIFLKRFGEPEDVSGVVAFLASDDAAYITGENIIAAGGIHSRLIPIMSQQILHRLSGRSALVTGSTYGIGYAIAKRLAEEGAKVIISSRKKENVDEATKNLRDQGLDVSGLVCHVSSPDDRKRLLKEAEKNNGLDILVCSAGVNPAVGPLFSCSESAWDKIFDVNLKASYQLTKEALPLLKQSKAGRVIYNSSVSAIHVFKDLGPYATSKAALCALTRYAAYSLGPDNITVNSVVPGCIKTRFSEVLTPNEEETKKLISMIYLKRLGETKDVSGVVAFLASDDAAYITGENIVVCGGI
ncbi:uncharacterized protein LOC108909766 [Anoplophora glabripennis]|uniref:uncharacterized protein LOC108909766 n=1 Tax=Anoplophora glabripennis TaxID=217634 RepID=UPI0008755D89|nr:uncharacterized protein LOC108909766 [Anoplophora glabripennis]